MSAQSLTDAEIAQEFGQFAGYRGWSLEAARADFANTGGAGKGGTLDPGATGGQVLDAQTGGVGTGDLVGLARQSLELQREFAAPAIETLKGAIGDVKQRYQELLKTFVPEAQRIATTELGKRGIPISSTSAQEQIARRGREVTSGLTAEELAQTTPIQTAIAQLQAGGSPGDVLGGALNLLNLQQRQREFSQTLPLEQQALDLQRRQLEAQLSRPTGGTGAGGGGAIDFQGLFNQFTGGSGLQQQIQPSVTGGATARQRTTSRQIQPFTSQQQATLSNPLLNIGAGIQRLLGFG